jgi:chemotaxis protein methyltransferase CheR
LTKYFEKTGNGKYLLSSTIKKFVRIASVNLMDPHSTGRIRDIDCIFCRNVMIYFDDSDKKRCAEHLYESLSDDGFVFLGHSESLGRISNLFEPFRLKHTIAYRKPKQGFGSQRQT